MLRINCAPPQEIPLDVMWFLGGEPYVSFRLLDGMTIINVHMDRAVTCACVKVHKKTCILFRHTCRVIKWFCGKKVGFMLYSKPLYITVKKTINCYTKHYHIVRYGKGKGKSSSFLAWHVHVKYTSFEKVGIYNSSTHTTQQKVETRLMELPHGLTGRLWKSL